MSLRLGQFLGALLGLALVGAVACRSYDAGLLPLRGQAGEGASPEDGSASGMSDAAAADASRPARDGASRDASSRSDSGRGSDAGSSGSGCHPNPSSLDHACPTVCPETCNGQDDDCDGKIDEETSAACLADHSTTTCQQGTCLIVMCETGYRDCDHRAESGCEAPLDDDPNNCGACNHACTGQHAKLGCSQGRCVALGCVDGFGDCDSDPFTCETPNGKDTDGDGVYDCVDNCPQDANKSQPGLCGCGVSDTDSDADGTPDCRDGCPSDATKTAAGLCGCGVPDTDTDGDGTPNCKDGCPADPTKATLCLSFAPSNFDPAPINFSAQASATLNCGTTTVDTTDPDGTGPLVATITNWCGTAPTPIAQTQSNGPSVVIVALRDLSLPSGNTLRLVGSRPVIFAVDGNVTIAGVVDADANGTTVGAGGNWSCGGSQGGDGSGDTSRNNGASGGGGGGFGTAGGKGGDANTDNINCCSQPAGGSAGATRGTTTSIQPLFGGCAGGQAGACTTTGGAGGGAVQISAGGSLAISGTVRANGGLGATPCGGSDEGGGSGGGSGGAILVESRTPNTTGATIQVNGGSGGSNGSSCGIYSCGGTSGGAGATSASNPGSAGANTQAGGPGGGGGYGRIQILTR